MSSVRWNDVAQTINTFYLFFLPTLRPSSDCFYSCHKWCVDRNNWHLEGTLSTGTERSRLHRYSHTSKNIFFDNAKCARNVHQITNDLQSLEKESKIEKGRRKS